MPGQRIRHRGLALAIVCLAALIINVDNTILNVALPTLVRDLQATSSQLQWIVDSYAIVFAGLLLVGGTLADRFGRKRFFLIGLTGTVEVAQAGQRVNTLGPCDFFGELAALNRGLRNATVTALSGLELLIIGPRELDAMARIPGFRDALLKGWPNAYTLSMPSSPRPMARKPVSQRRSPPKLTSESLRKRPRQDSNLRHRLRRPVLYPLSYGGGR